MLDRKISKKLKGKVQSASVTPVYMPVWSGDSGVDRTTEAANL